MRPSPRPIPLLLALLLAACGSGCVHRRLTVRSNPSGALVEVNGKRIGVTPASMDFTYYGTYDIRMSLPGYETLEVKQPVAPPWYQVPPLDAVSDNLIPVQLTNRHEYSWNLQQLGLEHSDDNALRNRGEDFRTRARVGP
jgi:hypothetical protein